MKFYFTSGCVMGWIPWLERYIPFATEQEYVEFYHDRE